MESACSEEAPSSNNAEFKIKIVKKKGMCERSYTLVVYSILFRSRLCTLRRNKERAQVVISIKKVILASLHPVCKFGSSSSWRFLRCLSFFS